MIGVDEALSRVLAMAEPLPAITVPLLEALGLTTATAIVAAENVPPFRNSAMDGYAVRAADIASASSNRPVALRVTADVAAGHPSSLTIGPGEAARIMTGAPVPDGADTVVRFEETDEGTAASSRDRSRVLVRAAMEEGSNVRLAGEDVRAGAVVLPSGTRLRPAEIGVLASLGHARVTVHRRPRVAILATGDEVVPCEATPGPGQIRDSNSHTLAALTRRCGGEPELLGIAHDRLEDVTARLAAAGEHDLVVTTAGVSVGDYDVVKQALQAVGSIALWQVNMKPGRPLAFGRIGQAPFLGLPGNPVAAVVSFELFARPLLRRLLGEREIAPRQLRATTTVDLDNASARRHFVRARLERDEGGSLVVAPVGNQGSGVLTSLIEANCLAIVPEGTARVKAGESVETLLLDWD